VLNRFLHAEGQAWHAIRYLELGKKFAVCKGPWQSAQKISISPEVLGINEELLDKMISILRFPEEL
jgi:hypothetical protein